MSAGTIENIFAGILIILCIIASQKNKPKI